MIDTSQKKIIVVEVLGLGYRVTVALEGIPRFSQEFPDMLKALEFAIDRGDALGIPHASMYITASAVELNAAQTNLKEMM